MTRKCLALITATVLFNVNANMSWMAWADIEAAKNAGANIGSQIRASWATPKNLSNKVTKPVMTGDVPLETLDKSEAQIVNVTCPGTQELFKVLVQPGATKDLRFINVIYDQDLDGTLDSRVEVPGPVSGVCANGFVSCDPGTWENCRWFQWGYDGTLAYNPSSPAFLGGCFCINSGCTPASFMTMKNQVLNTIAGGIAAVLAGFNPRYAVAKAQIDGFLITYYGQNAGSCDVADVHVSGAYPRPEDVFDDPETLEVITESEYTTQAANSSSIYSKLTSSPAFTGMETQTCTMTRSAYFDATTCSIQEPSTNGCLALASDPSCALQKEVVYDLNGNPVVTYENYGPTGLNPLETCMTFSPGDLSSTDVNQCIALGKVETDGGCSITYTCTGIFYSPALDLWRCSLSATGHNSCGDIFDYQVCGAASLAWNIPDDPCERITFGASTVRDFCPGHSGGSTPTPDSGSLDLDSGSTQVALHASFNNTEACNGWAGGAVAVYLNPLLPRNVCHDWWRVERDYVCRGAGGYTPDISRADAVSVSEGDTGWTYTDMNDETGHIEFPAGEAEPCVKACKLETTEGTSDADESKTTRTYRHEATSKLVIYRTCVDDVCPAKDRETIVKDCQCLNEFNIAYGVMELLKQATADQVCSTK